MSAGPTEMNYKRRLSSSRGNMSLRIS